MKCKIAVFGYHDFIETTKEIFQQYHVNVSIDLYSCFLNECTDYLPLLNDNDTDIIITGRAFKTLMEDKTKIPIITYHITPIDILSAIKKALPHSRRIAIALASFEEHEYKYSILEDLLNIEIKHLSYETENELRSKIQKFSETNGIVIGTNIATGIAKEFGLFGILIYSLENSIAEAVDRALEIYRYKREEEEQHKKFKAIINSVSDGIIATNDQNQITIMNDYSKSLLGITDNDILGKPLSDIVSNKSLKELTDLGENFHDKIIKFGQSTLNTNQTPVLVKGKKVGNVLTFQDITKIEKIEQKYRIENEARGLQAKNHFDDIISSSSMMNKVKERAKKYSTTDSTILIIGETGTGKEIFAQSIHNFSNRKVNPFVAINCAALPESLLESELFGYESGAFTGASKNGKKGLFEIAHNGTIFLDEINSISLHFQARLLRILQEKEIVRIGGSKIIPINVRIIAATNQDLLHLVSEGKFRADLFYRLNLLNIHLPPLRERLEDIIPISKAFILQKSYKLYGQIEQYLEDILAELFTHKFPGNIRELFNILERFVILTDLETATVKDYKKILKGCIDVYPELLTNDKKVEFELKENYMQSLSEAEVSLMKKYISLYSDNKTQLSEKIGLGRTTLYRKLKELNIEC